MERLINRVLKKWSKYPGLPSLKRDGLREQIANDIVNSMRGKSTGNGWFLDLNPSSLTDMTNSED